MVPPYKNPTELEDNYSFYHSELGITIECAFGMQVHR